MELYNGLSTFPFVLSYDKFDFTFRAGITGITGRSSYRLSWAQLLSWSTSGTRLSIMQSGSPSAWSSLLPSTCAALVSTGKQSLFSHQSKSWQSLVSTRIRQLQLLDLFPVFNRPYHFGDYTRSWWRAQPRSSRISLLEKPWTFRSIQWHQWRQGPISWMVGCHDTGSLLICASSLSLIILRKKPDRCLLDWDRDRRCPC